ncbi:MAG: PQQ-binding-like beta-propeller repeat protein [Planctomycetaceae bacterium]
MRRTADAPRYASLLVFVVMAICAAVLVDSHPVFAGPQNEPSRRDLLLSYKRAVDLLNSEERRRGITAMQAVVVALDSKDDVFLPAENGSQRSLKMECFEQLKSLSDGELDFYEQQFGPEANAQLKLARTNDDLEAIDAVSRQYFYTEAGTAAARELALRKLDRGDALGAALDLSRLRTLIRNSGKLEPALSVTLATAWAQAGVPAEAERVLRLAAKSGYTELETTESRLVLEPGKEADWLPAMGQAAAFDNWSMPLGNMQRTRRTGRVVPRWKPQWQVNALETLVIETPDDQAAAKAGFDYVARSVVLNRRERERLRLHAVPASTPLVVGDRVIFRSPLTVKAIRSRGDDDYEAGELEWETYKPDPFMMSSFRSHEDGQNLNAIESMSRAYAYRDRTSGSMTSDGKFVFVIEETDRMMSQQMLRAQRGPELLGEPNFLRAYELSSGSVAWQIGGDGGIRVAGMRDAVFLGPPMPFGEDLLVIAASRDELRLLQLQVRNPSATRPDIRLVWSQQISRVNAERGLPAAGRLSGLSPAFMGGVLICPTGYGDLVALDPASRSLLWRFAPEEPISRPGRGWTDPTPRIVDGLAIWTPLQSNSVHCVDLETGEPRWVATFANGAWTAVTKRVVVCVGGDRVMAFLTSTGKPAWKEPVRIGQPTGRGLLHGEMISIPTSGGTVLTLDLNTGNVLAETISPVPLGNLVAAGGTIVSQTPTALVSFAGFEAIQRQIADSLKADPQNADTLLTQSIMYLQTGALNQGLQSLKAAADLKSNPLAARMLVKAVTGLKGDLLRQHIGLLDGLEEPAPPVAMPTSIGLIGPVQAVASLVSPMQDSATLKTLLARFDSLGELNAVTAKKLFEPLFELAAQSSDDRIVVSKERVVSERRYLAVQVRRLLKVATESNRSVLAKVIERTVASGIDARRFDEARQLLAWFPKPGNRLRMRLALSLRDVEPDQSISLLESIRESSTDPLRLRATRLLIEQTTMVRPNRARIIANELRFESATSETAATVLSELEANPKYAKTVSHERAWPVVDIKVQKTDRFDFPERQGVQTHGMPSDNLLLYREGTNLLGFDRWHQKTIDVACFDEDWVPSRDDELYALETPTSLVLSSNEVAVYDLVGGKSQSRLLWRQKLKRPETGRRSFFQISHRLVGPVAGQTLLIRSGNNLLAKDLRTGATLWSRSMNVRSRTLHADEQTLAVVGQGMVEFYSMFDGSWLESRSSNFQASLNIADVGRGRVMGRVARRDGESLVELVRSDFGVLEPRWRHEFDAETTLSNSAAGFCAAIDGDRQIHVFRLKDGRRVASVQGNEIPDVDVAVLHTTADELLVIGQTRRAAFARGQVQRGFVVAIDRASGQKLWEKVLGAETVLTEADFDVPFRGGVRRYEILGANLPVLVLAGRVGREGFSYRVLDCRSGDVVYEGTNKIPLTTGRVRVQPDDRTLHLEIGQEDSLKLMFPDE